MSSLSGREPLKPSNNQEPRDGREVQTERAPRRSANQQKTNRLVRNVRESNVQAAPIETHDSRPQNESLNQPLDGQKSPLGEGAALLEESAANKSTNEEATIRGTDQSKGQSHSQKGGSDVGTTTLSRETKQNTGDERSPDAESLAIIQAQIRGLQSDKAKLVKELNYTKSQLRDSQQATAETLDNSQRHMDSIVGKTAKELLNLQKKLEKAEAERAEYQRNFKDAQEKIFSMQPRRSDITEDEAIEEYSSLCVNVENWIETNLGDVLDLDYQIFAQSKVDVLGGSQLIGLIEMTRGGALALDIPDTLLYCLRNAIMNFICHRIFQGDLYAGDPGPWPFISFIETNMRNLEPRRDHVAIRAWRSETLMAVTASSEYESARRQRIHELAASLCGCIQVLLPKATKEQLVLLQKSLAQDLIIPAIKLSEKFHVSGKLFTQLGRGLDDERANITQELERYECRNLLENGRMVKTLQSGVDCEYVMDICPGLYCSSLKGDAISAPKRLKKTQILVAVTRPGRSHILHEETALGHIYKSVQEYKIAENKEIERKELEAKQKSSWFSGDRFF